MSKCSLTYLNNNTVKNTVHIKKASEKASKKHDTGSPERKTRYFFVYSDIHSVHSSDVFKCRNEYPVVYPAVEHCLAAAECH